MNTKAALALFVMIGTALPGARPASAQEWPARPIHWIVPVGPGGGIDVTARILQDPVSRILGKPIIVENRPGAGSIVGTQAVIRAKPDGYTFGLIYAAHAINPSLREKMPYDSENGVTPVAFMWRAWLALSVRQDSPITSLERLIALAKEKPGTLAFGTGGLGQTSDVAAEDLEQKAGVKFSIVPYEGAGAALNDMLAGHIPVLVSTLVVVLPHVKAGAVRTLAVTAPERTSLMPDAPTVAESGIPGFQFSEWTGLIAPANLPPAITAKMNAAINQALEDPKVAAQLKGLGFNTAAQTPTEFAQFLKEQTVLMTKVIKTGGRTP